jgi:hypothetical protein
MSSRQYSKYIKIIVPIIVGIGLLFLPLLGDFHIESALFVSLAGCFWAGIRACNKPEKNSDFFTALRLSAHLFLVGLPLLLNALFTGCFSIDGLAFWLLFPLPSVFFGYAIGRLLRSWNLSYCRSVTVAILAAVGIGIFLYELLTYPQVYFFNHVWGGWPGPIYDEVVQINGATLFFRSLTVLWAVLLWYIPALNREKYASWIVGFAVVSIVLSYTQLTEFGVISARPHLQNVLGGQETTEHFELYYDQRLYSDYKIDLLAKEHEFFFERIANQLDLPPRNFTKKIESYLYGHPWQKKELVGAKFTSFVPVWLGLDQLHIAKQQINHSLKHELVHVLAKEFGNDLFNASWSIGLIEGVAVAIDGGSSKTSTVDQIVVSEEPYPTAEELQNAFSPRGFYGGRSGVNYTTSGSFVRYLINNYPVESLKNAYRTGSITEAYNTDWETLTEKWHQALDTVEVDTVDRRIARRIFGIPSLFEQECPHVVSDYALAEDSYRFNLANRDTVRALEFLDRAVAEADSLPPIKAEWSYRNLIAGHPQKVQQAATLRDTTVDLQLLYADAFALTNDIKQARSHIARAETLFQQNPDSLLKPALATRLDRRQWEIYRQMTYHNELPDSATFSEAHYRTKIRSLRKAIEKQCWSFVEKYATQLLKKPFYLRYFDEYQHLIHHLVFLDNRELARKIVTKLSQMSLRNRYIERLRQEKEWISYLESDSGLE